ncbi:MAG: hypothetical protein LC802_16650 [Acidobacteria bacterium]|nr:hypothetical protein [Acidobacteriota bacterium]
MHSPDSGERRGHTILLGGIGGDSHSVGLSILRQALAMNDYRVYYLGTQNRLEDFFELAPMSNAVMISSMDGHARYYLREFARMRRERAGVGSARWYLGGNLHIGDASGYEKYFLEMGFDRAFVKFVDVKTVLELLARDLSAVEPVPYCPTLLGRPDPEGFSLPGPAPDEPLDLRAFQGARAEVLEGWKTGHRARDLAENAEFLGRQPSFPKLQAEVGAGGLPILIQPRSGVPLLREQIRLFKAFKSVGVPVLSFQVDSLTRNNNYAGAEEAIRESRATGVASLNGFPVVNHGVPGVRRVITQVGTPLQTRHSTRDPRLLAEISYAGGVTSFEGGAICYNLPYYKDYPVDESIRAWQYVDRLTGLYHELFGIKLDREFFGTLTATLIPPSIAIAVDILEAILAVRQGVKCVSLGYAEQGNRPESQQNAERLIHQSAASAALSGATRVIIKTAAEAIKIPTMEDNVHAIGLVMRGTSEAAGLRLDEALVAEECAVIEREVQAILDSVILAGRGSVTEGIVKAFRLGHLDIPFSPSRHNRGEVVTARDTEGAVRFLRTGQLQFDRGLLDFHREKMSERRRAEGLRSERQNYLLVERDVLQIARGQYECWPLFGGSNGTGNGNSN